MSAEDALLDLLGGLGPVRVRRMFGGRGLYRDQLMFGLLFGETLYLKTDAVSRPAWEAAGSAPFEYATKTGRRVLTSYWRLPEEALDDSNALQAWVRLALDAAGRVDARAKPRADASGLGAGPWTLNEA